MTVASAAAATTRQTLPAHAKVISSDPAIGSTIAQVPTKITVTAAEGINPDPKLSNLIVYGPGADATDTVVSKGNATIPLSQPDHMSIAITPNSGHTDGVYIVYWKTTSSDDGDAADGAFTFTVKSSAASVTPTPTVSQQTGAPATGTNTDNSGGIPIWASIIVAIVVLLLGIGIGLLVGRRGGSGRSSFGSMRASIAQDTKESQ